MIRLKTVAKIASTLAIFCSISSSAQAGGWLADNLIKPVFGSHAAREADKVHEQIGKPGDKAVPVIAGAVADAVVPGSGSAVTTIVEEAKKH